MSSCLAGKPERLGPVEVEDIRRALHGDFSAQQPQVHLGPTTNMFSCKTWFLWSVVFVLFCGTVVFMGLDHT